MRRKRAELSEAIGTDAFLDIVANLVGILLILIMVIGVRMEDASKSAVRVASASVAPQPLPELVEYPKIDVPDSTDAKLELSKLKTAIREADEEAKRLEQLMKLQKMDRDNLMLAITKAELELEKRRSALDESQRANVAVDLARQETQDDYESVMAQLNSLKLAAQEDKQEVLQHVATPIAKTVFVREEHFRLKDGRLLFVPLNEMTNRLRAEAPKKMWKLKTARQTTESIGPQDGFQMRYTLRRNRVPFRTESGLNAAREVVELDRFVMVPVSGVQGETLAEALSPGSAFESRVAQWDPRDTIVTVWTYPDSFSQFRELKRVLYERGFLTAARPLPANQLISGSPQGTRSAAQ